MYMHMHIRRSIYIHVNTYTSRREGAYISLLTPFGMQCLQCLFCLVHFMSNVRLRCPIIVIN